MRMPAIMAEQREIRRVLKGALEEARPLVESGRAAFNDVQLEMEGSTRPFLASGDTAQLNQVIGAARESLEACEAALPVLEQFEENFSLAPAFDRVARRFLAEEESPDALQFVRPEADYLRSRGFHLGGASTFHVDASAPQRSAPDQAQVHTVEQWLYDERDQSDMRQRCFVEDSDQTYVLKQAGQTWVVDQIQLGGSHRSDCPPGT